MYCSVHEEYSICVQCLCSPPQRWFYSRVPDAVREWRVVPAAAADGAIARHLCGGSECECEWLHRERVAHVHPSAAANPGYRAAIEEVQKRTSFALDGPTPDRH